MTAMVDWLTALVPCVNPGDVWGGFVTAQRADGSVEWSSARRLQLEGSHSSAIAVRSSGTLDLEISGNPAKFLQGHNLFGSPDVLLLGYRLAERVTARLGLVPSDADRAAWRAGDYQLRRVDCTRSYDLVADDQVRRWLTGGGALAHGRHQRVSQYDSQTIYLGKHSRRAALKLYNKFRELQQRGHQLPETLSAVWRQSLLEWSAGKLRAEATLRSMELRDRGLDRAAAWSPAMVDRVLDERLGKLELNDTMRLAEEVLDDLPARLVGVYEAWRAGHDLRTIYSRPTFYRYRSQLLAYGVDIGHPRPREVVAETQYLLGRPLRSFLDGPGVEPPAWARGTELLVS